VTLDTTGVTKGPGAPPVEVTITLTVSDGKGGTGSGTCSLTVYSVKKLEAEHLQPDLVFRQRSARVDNVHKAILNDIALRLQQEPQDRLYIDGHCDRGEPVRLAEQRAQNVKRDLVTRLKVDPNRIVVRSFGATRPDPSGERAKNRRVELWIVPPGAEIPK